MKKNKKVLAALLAVVLCVAPFTVGCGDDKDSSNGKVVKADSASSAAPSENETAVNSEDLPEGKNIDAKLGEDVPYSNGNIKLNAKLDKVIKIPNAPNDTVYYIAQITVKNDSSDDLDFAYIGDFKVMCDDTDYTDKISAIAAYYTMQNYDIKPAYDGIKAGETKSGMVPMAIKDDFKQLKLIYKPSPETSNDTITYTVDASEFTVEQAK